MKKSISIAVVLTVFNRKEQTEKCLLSVLREIKTDKSINIDFYITNDKSTDATGELLNSFQKKYTNINFFVFEGTGNLYWNKGMHLAYGEALKSTYDFYLWVNNDVEFYEGFLHDLLKDYSTAKKNNMPVIICGSVSYRGRKEISYGGAVNYSKINPYKRTLLIPSGSVQECDCINANCLLIPWESALLVGNLEERYEHGFGDFDYGYRLIKAGGQPFVASNFVGKCDRNSLNGSWKDSSLPIKKRVALKNSPTGQPPYSHKLFLKKWFPAFWYYYWIKPYARIIISSIVYKVRKQTS